MVEELAPSSPTSLSRPPHAARRLWLDVASLTSLMALALVVLVFVGYFAVYLAYARNLFAFPFDYDQGEGFELYDAVRLARGQNIYLDNAQFPFYSSNYPPVYRLMLVPFVAIFGPKLYVGRAVAFACSIVIGAVIFLAARRVWTSGRVGRWAEEQVTRSPAHSLIPLLAALAFFAANYVYHVGPLARAHLPMVMFAMAGIFCLDVGLAQPATKDESLKTSLLRPSSCVIGVGLLLLAGFTKLQAVDALVAGFVYLLIRRPKGFAVALIACALVTAAVVIPLNVSTQGQFWLNVVSANVNEYDINVTWKTYAQWFQLQGVLIVCSVIYVVWDVVGAIRARSFKPITIWSLYFVAGSAMGMLTGKWGAGPTYLIAAIAASCVCTAGLLARIGNRQLAICKRPLVYSHLPVVSLLASLVFLTQAALNVHLPTHGRMFGPVARLAGVADAQSSYPPYAYFDSVGYTQLGHFVLPEDVENGWALARAIEQLEGPVLSEEAMLTLWAGKDVVTNPTQLLNLSKAGLLDTNALIGSVERREFGGVVFRAMFYPDDVKDAIVRNYYWATKYRINGFDYWLLLPGSKN